MPKLIVGIRPKKCAVANCNERQDWNYRPYCRRCGMELEAMGVIECNKEGTWIAKNRKENGNGR